MGLLIEYEKINKEKCYFFPYNKIKLLNADLNVTVEETTI